MEITNATQKIAAIKAAATHAQTHTKEILSKAENLSIADVSKRLARVNANRLVLQEAVYVIDWKLEDEGATAEKALEAVVTDLLNTCETRNESSDSSYRNAVVLQVVRFIVNGGGGGTVVVE